MSTLMRLHLGTAWALALQALTGLLVAAAAWEPGPDDAEALMQTRLDPLALVEQAGLVTAHDGELEPVALPIAPVETTTTSATANPANPSVKAVVISVRAKLDRKGGCNGDNGEWMGPWPKFRIRNWQHYREWVVTFSPCNSSTNIEGWNLPAQWLPEPTSVNINYFLTLLIFESGLCEYQFAKDDPAQIQAAASFECKGLFPEDASTFASDPQRYPLFNLTLAEEGPGGRALTPNKQRTLGDRTAGRVRLTTVRSSLTYALAPLPSKSNTVPHVHCHAQGDPHYRNYSKKKYDYHGLCTILMATTREDAGEGFQTEVFNCRMSNTRMAAVTVGVAVQLESSGSTFVVTWYDGTTRIDGVKFGPGLWCLLSDGVEDGLELGGCGGAGAVQILQMPIIKGPTREDGGFAEVQVFRKDTKGSNPIGYSLKVYVDIPTDWANESAGLCSANESTAHAWHLNPDPDSSFFVKEDLDKMMEICAPNPAEDCQPVLEPPISVSKDWDTIPCDCPKDPGLKEAKKLCKPVKNSDAGFPVYNGCLLDYCTNNCSEDAVDSYLGAEEEEQDGVDEIDIDEPGPPPTTSPAPASPTTSSATTSSATTSSATTSSATTSSATTSSATTSAATTSAATTPPPTSSPAPATTPSPTSRPNSTAALGDPHCRNVRGERFDIHAIGRLAMVRVPQGGRRPGSELFVHALVQPVRRGHCAATVIKRVDISGSWSRLGPLRLEPGAQGEPAVLRAGSPLRNLHELRDIERKAHGRMLLQAGPVQVRVHQRQGEKTGIKYLDLSVSGLKELGLAAGGLLGRDSHLKVARLPPGCADDRVILDQQQEAEGLENSTRRLLSRAEVLTGTELSLRDDVE